MQARDGDRVVELPPDVVLEVARAYARKAAGTPKEFLLRGPWVLRTLLGRQADTPFNKKRSRRHNLQRRGEGVLQDGYNFRVIAEQCGLKRTSHHKTWVGIFVALSEEVVALFEFLWQATKLPDSVKQDRRNDLHKALGLVMQGVPFPYKVVQLLSLGEYPLLTEMMWLRGGAPLMNSVCEKGHTPLCVAAATNIPKAVERLLRYNAHVDGPWALGIDKPSPLLRAARYGHIDVAKILVRHNASLRRGYGGSLPSDVALEYGHHDCALLLKQYEEEEEEEEGGADA